MRLLRAGDDTESKDVLKMKADLWRKIVIKEDEQPGSLVQYLKGAKPSVDMPSAVSQRSSKNLCESSFPLTWTRVALSSW